MLMGYLSNIMTTEPRQYAASRVFNDNLQSPSVPSELYDKIYFDDEPE